MKLLTDKETDKQTDRQTPGKRISLVEIIKAERSHRKQTHEAVFIHSFIHSFFKELIWRNVKMTARTPKQRQTKRRNSRHRTKTVCHVRWNLSG